MYIQKEYLIQNEPQEITDSKSNENLPFSCMFLLAMLCFGCKDIVIRKSEFDP